MIEAIRLNHGNLAYHKAKEIKQHIDRLRVEAESSNSILQQMATHKMVPTESLGDEIDEEDKRK